MRKLSLGLFRSDHHFITSDFLCLKEVLARSRNFGPKYPIFLEVRFQWKIFQKKWKYLRDPYVRAKKKVNQYKPSGSAAQAPPDPGFKFFEAMKFIDDGGSEQRTVCSFEPSTETNETREVQPGCSSGASSSYSTPLMSPETVTPSVKRKKAEEKTRLDVQKEIASIMSRPAEKPIDRVDGCLIRLGESLRKLPYRERAKLEINIMSMVYEAELKNDI